MCRRRDKKREFAARVNFYLRRRSARFQGAGNTLIRVVARTKLIEPRETGPPQLGCSPTNNYAFALSQIAKRFDVWLRPAHDWRPRSKNARKQFGGLVRYLFARYDVPDFMDCAWFGEGEKGERHRRLFLAIGRGCRIQSIGGMPIRFTGKLLHAFLRAPANLTIDQSARWAQVIAMGANRRLVEAVMATKLGETYEHWPFWQTVIQFFIEHPDLDSRHFGPIVDFLDNQKFTPRGWTRIAGDLVQVGPPKPHLSMKGRTVKTVLRDVERWHRDLARTQGGREWAPCGIAGMERVEGEGKKRRVYTIKELTRADDLRHEGRMLRHCVASYAQSCASGRRAIFGLRRSDFLATDQPWLTIRVDVHRRMITEARGFRNTPATQEQLRLVRAWAARNNIATASYI